MTLPRLVQCDHTFIIKDWEGDRPPLEHICEQVMCWHNLERPCTTVCAACWIEECCTDGSDLYCQALPPGSCIGHLQVEDQLYPRRV